MKKADSVHNEAKYHADFVMIKSGSLFCYTGS